MEETLKLGSDEVATLMIKFKSTDEAISADLQKYGLSHVNKMDILLPEGGIKVKTTENGRLVVVSPGTAAHAEYLSTLEKIADEAGIKDPDTLKELATLSSDKLHLFTKKYPQYTDPMDTLTIGYTTKYPDHFKTITDPVDRENMVKFVRELELRQNNPGQVNSRLNELTTTCKL